MPTKQVFPYIYIDEHLSIYYSYLYGLDAKIIIANTKLSTQKVLGIPPLDSNFIPRGNLFDVKICECLWLKSEFYWKLRRVMEAIAFLGKSDSFFEDRIIERNWKERPFNKVQRLGYSTVSVAQTIILAPKSFEFQCRTVQKNESFIFSSVERIEIIPSWYIHFCKRLVEFKKNTDFQLIYCSFGTNTRNSLLVKNFLTILSKALKGKKNWFVVVSDKYFSIQQDNLLVVKQVPQLSLLAISDIMITHGGLVSIKECILSNTPMLVYPLNGDQYGNSARVLANGLGLRGNIKAECEAGVVEKIEFLKKNSRSFEKNLKTMSYEKV